MQRRYGPSLYGVVSRKLLTHPVNATERRGRHLWHSVPRLCCTYSLTLGLADMNYKERWAATRHARKAWRKARKAEKALWQLIRRRDAPQQTINAWKATIARGMRANPTRCEAILYDALTAAKIEFKAQVQVGPYIVDALLHRKHVIEVDGSSHVGREDYDLARDRYMWNRSYRVLRLSNGEVSKDPSAAIEKIKAFMGQVA